MLRIRILLPLLAGVTIGPIYGQVDAEAIGGGDDPAMYDDRATEDGIVALTFKRLNDVNDSLQWLPYYDTYCHWDMETIFPAGLSHMQPVPVSLQLSTQACDHAMPICGALNSDFGWRRGRMHYGLDLDLEKGDAVRSAFEGVVRISRYHRTFGHVVVVRHWNGLETLYGHLSKRFVEPGDPVEAGDTLGLGGSTGRSTGNHLHFEIRYLGKPINPKFIFDLEDGALKTTTLQVSKGLFESASGTRSYHIVRRGDSLSAISNSYGTSVAQLCRLNQVSTRSILRVGQRVRYR